MSLWGPLTDRFEGSENGQHKMLAIDGGGIRGILALEILAGLEKQLAAAFDRPQDEFRLSEFFDYVAGTSTGAVIAAGIARGLRVSDLLEFYRVSGPLMFDNRFVKKMQSWFTRGATYDEQPLANELRKMFGADTTLEPDHLECLFLAVTRNQTTDSPWPISSNPQAKYNDPSLPDCNMRMPLWRIVRASTAAPMVFRAEQIDWDPDKKQKDAFLFVDGGVTPYNNPAWLLYRMATEPGYRLKWATGEDKLLLVSVGTGTSPKGDDGVLTPPNVLSRIWSNRKIVGSLIQGAMVDQDINCRQIGRCVHGIAIDGEVGDQIPRDASGKRVPLSENLGRSFLYARYNVKLTQDVLDDMGLSHIAAEAVQKLNSVDYVDELREVGSKVAEEVRLTDFATFVPASG